MIVTPFIIIEQIVQRLKDKREVKKETVERETVEREFWTFDEFINLEKGLKVKGYNVPGIYIISNIENNKKYVGQSINPINRVKTHIRGRGNPDIYYDMKSGQNFAVKITKLRDTQFSNLNDLERHYIAKHNSYYSGYNKTRGNNPS